MKCKDEGTLNLLSIAFQRLVEDISPQLTDAVVVEHCINVVEAYKVLDYRLPLVLKSAVNALKSRPVCIRDRIKVLHGIDEDILEELRNELFSTITRKDVEDTSVNDVLKLSRYAYEEDLRSLIRVDILKRMSVQHDRIQISEVTQCETDGREITRQITLDKNQIQSVLDLLGDNFQHRDTLVRLLH
jgi:hypothetical protein